MSTTRSALWTEVRDHVETEAGVLTWIQSDAEGEAGGTSVAFEDLDSFTFIQLLLSVEAAFDVELLEELGDFRGTTFDDVTDFVVAQVERSRGEAAARS
ncbi:hypothetical protein [Nocardioides zeae]|uniref:Acyl carrier protein n=1 Tax=Nocardioides zeae TaxID=1457234 RepID=A0A6P0HHV1_9ACTN|nr:hypothetical protein [Nocardioides zeae]NEN77807.1 hypothetical protein [Nocardioides zeae]